MLPQRGLMTSALDVRAVCVVLRSIVQAKMKPGNAATRCVSAKANEETPVRCVVRQAVGRP